MNSLLDSALRSLRRARFWAHFVGTLGSWLLVTLLAAGSGILLGRFFGAWTSGQAWWLLLGAGLAPLAAWVAARRSAWSVGHEATYLDVSAGGDGSLVTHTELRDARWEGRMEQALTRIGPGPTPEWKVAFLRAGAGACFVLLALWVPMPATAKVVRPGFFQGTLADLEESLETLEEDVGLKEERASELAERLERLQEQADGEQDPEGTYEALDALERDLEQAAAELADVIEQAVSELAQQESRGLEEGKDSMQAVLERLAEGGLQPPSPGEMGAFEWPEGLALPEGFEWPEGAVPGELGDLSPDQLAALSEALRQELLERMQVLADAGLLDELSLANTRSALAQAVEGELCAECAKGEP